MRLFSSARSLNRSLVTGLLLLAVAPATPAQYRYDVWATDQGLPQNTVSAILQTRDGYLWFTTLDGLVRYDGVRFTVFDRGNTKGINSTRFNTLCEDPEGNLWAGTQDGGLTRYRDGVFTSYTTETGLPDTFIRGIFNDGENGLLVVPDSGRMFHWRNGQFIPYEPAGGDFSGFTYLGRSGALWDLTRAGLRRYKDGSLSTYPMPDDFTGYGHYFRARYESNDGSFWVGLRNFTLHRWQDGRVTVYPAGSHPDELVGAFCEDRQGNFWVGTRKGELRQLKDGRFITVATLPGADITSILEDREGNIWVGSLLHGLYRLRLQVITVYTKSDGLASDNTYPIFEDREGNVWIGGYGLTRYRDGVFHNYSNIDTAIRDEVTSILEDREGRLWLGGNGKVGWLRDGKYTSFGARLGLSMRTVYAIYQDSQGRLWFGTTSGLIEYSGDRVATYRAGDGLAGDDVKEIYEDRKGRLWIATYGGLSVLQDGRFTSYTERDGLASNRVRTIYEDEDGIIWIGTYDGGLSRFKDGRFTSYTTREGLFNNGVFRILEDGRGNFWMSSNRGIYRVSRQLLNDYAEGKTRVITCVAYGKPDGLDNTECNGGRQPAGVRTRDGRLWFPTQGGVAVIDPEAVPFNSLPPPVVIEGCVLDREAVKHQPLLRIEAGKENLEIHYTGLSFIKPDQVRFRYRLEGLEQRWVDAGPRRTAYYSHIPPGDYTFRVIAANSDGVWNMEGASFQITVIPPFWQTWWFATLMALSLAGIIVLVYERRVGRLKRARAMQEAFSKQLVASQENERKRIAAELHDSLNQSLVIIKNRAALSLSDPEDHERAFEQLQEIADAATQAIDEVREIAYNLRPYQLDRLGLTRSIESMLKKASSTDSLRFAADLDPIDGLFSDEAEINFYRIVQESVNNILKHSGATQAKVTVRKSERALDLVVWDNGKGFAAGDVAPSDGSRRGFGLTGIAERARMIGGAHNIESAPGQGTTIRIRIGLKDGHHEQ